MWGRYLCSFSLFGANSTLYEALRGHLQKDSNVTRRIWGIEVILKRITDWVATLYTSNANWPKNTLYDVLARCYRFNTMSESFFFLKRTN